MVNMRVGAIEAAARRVGEYGARLGGRESLEAYRASNLAKDASRNLAAESRINQMGDELYQHNLKERSRFGLEPLDDNAKEELRSLTEKQATKAITPGPGILGKTANFVGNALNSPLLWAAPMVMPLIPGMNGDPSQQDQSQQAQMPLIDPTTQAQYQQMMAQQQMLGMTGGMR